MANRPFIHVVDYGAPGSGKSTFAATFPKPALLLMFDPLGKEGPYLKRGVVSPELEGEVGQPLVVVESRKTPGKTLIQVEYYHDTEVDDDGRYKPQAYRRFLRRFPSLYEEVRCGKWATVVVDTLTYMELSARKLSQYDLDKTSREPRRWFAAATDMLEEAVLCRLGTLRCNVVILAHVDNDKDEVAGITVSNPAAPGRLRTRLGGGYPEVYVQHLRRSKKDGTLEYYLQTRADGRYNASSVYLEAPDPCSPDYNALWVSYDARG
jgi:AAA domain-containing protein